MAYLRKRGDKWSFTVDIGQTPDGKREQKTESGFKTKKEAQLKASKIEEEVAEGTFIKETTITLKKFAEEWLEMYGENSKISTKVKRENEIKNLLSCLSEDIKIKDVTPKLYQTALNELRKKGYAKSTIEGIHAAGKMIFRRAMEFRTIKSDPTEFARLPKVQKTVEEIENKTDIPGYMEKNELKIFLDTAQKKGTKNDYVFFLTLAYTGMRLGELCALKWSDINMEEKTISITKTYHNFQNSIKDYHLVPPKTESSIRVIEVDKTVIDKLEKHKAVQNELRMKHNDIYHKENFVFARDTKHYGYPYCHLYIERRMNILLKYAGLPKNFTPHTLRHTHTSLMAEAGVGLEEIMERLGHSDDKITKTVYLHVTKTMKKEASQKFSKLMSSF